MIEVETKPDGTARHASTVAVLRHFRVVQLPPTPTLQAISRACGELAEKMADTLPEGPDLTHGLRELLIAKDSFARAAL